MGQVYCLGVIRVFTIALGRWDSTSLNGCRCCRRKAKWQGERMGRLNHFNHTYYTGRDLVMVTSATSLTQSGIRDWLIQRVSAIILGLYTIFILCYIAFHPEFTYVNWHNLFSNAWMRMFSFLALLSIVLHSCVGVWTIFTDYIKPFALRLFLLVVLTLALLCYLAWGVQILWGL